MVRAQGQLLKQLIRYAVMPSGNNEFYGATGILEFKPGEREVVVALVARPDGVPEVRYGKILIFTYLFSVFYTVLQCNSNALSFPLSHLISYEVNVLKLFQCDYCICLFCYVCAYSWTRLFLWYLAATVLHLVVLATTGRSTSPFGKTMTPTESLSSSSRD